MADALFTLGQAAGWIGDARLHGDAALPVCGVSTDTRSLQPGDMFVAIRGERFDANEMAAKAVAAGAGSVLVERWTPGLDAGGLVVADSRVALGRLAAGWRRQFSMPVIGVTGSNGKTTVKEMIAAILAQAFGEAARFATPGNLNNDIGVPVSVLRLRASHRAAVLELGMNRPGEIAWLTGIAQPTVALVNNAQREHQEFMGTVQATAIENGASLAGLPAQGIAVYPGDDEHTGIWRGLAGTRRSITFGLTAGCDVSAADAADPKDFMMAIGGKRQPVTLAIPGRHNVRNALAAAACCLAIGVDVATIARGLAGFRPVSGRLVRLSALGGATLIDDSYNANPDSVRAAIDVLAGEARPQVLVLGDMGEVGDQGPQFHREVGAYARERGIDHLLTLGQATRDTVSAFGGAGEFFEDIEVLVARCHALDQAGATVLVKGSRFMRMERVVNALRGAPAVAGGH